MSFEIGCMAGRTYDFTVPLYQADGQALTLEANDVVRVKIGRGGVTSLDFSSDEMAENDSHVTITALSPASCNVRLAQADMELTPGPYDIEISVVDANDTAPGTPIKVADIGVLHVIGSPLSGPIGT
jgi:hypothetical protein